jgi:hypothetical protein
MLTYFSLFSRFMTDVDLFQSLEELTKKAVPGDILLDRELDLPEAMGQSLCITLFHLIRICQKLWVSHSALHRLI